MAVVKRVGIMSVAKISALMGIVIGLVYGIIMGFFISAVAPVMPGYPSGMGFVGLAMVIIGPIIGAVAYFILGAILAFLYNVFAGLVGGIELDLG